MTRPLLRNAALVAGTLTIAGVIVSRGSGSMFTGLEWLRHGTLPTVLLALGFFVVRGATLTRQRWTSYDDVTRRFGAEIALTGAAILALLVTHDWQFKVLDDETNFVGLARTLATQHRFEFPDVVLSRDATLTAQSFLFDKRPPLFAVVLAVADAVTGFRVTNVWGLNALVLGATALLLGCFLRARFSDDARPWSLLAIVWALASPVVMLTAESAGPEPLFGLLWLITIASSLSLLRSMNASMIRLFLATLVLLALCRAEGAPLAVLTFVGVIAVASDRRALIGVIAGDPMVGLAPFFALPLVLQRTRLGDYNEGLTDATFALKYVRENIGEWGRVFADGGRTYPFSLVVTVLAIVAVIALTVRLVRKKTSLTEPERRGALLFVLLTFALFVQYSAYFWAQPTNPLCARFYALPFLLAGAAVAIEARHVPFVRGRVPAFVIASALVFAFASPTSHDHPLVSETSARRSHAVVADYLRMLPDPRRTMLVTSHPSQFWIYDVAVVGFDAWGRLGPEVLKDLKRRTYADVFVVQKIITATGEVDPTTPSLPVELEPVLERYVGGRRNVRLSRIKQGSAGPPR